ncbi:MAG: prephenate dehydrogenase/arogenate dehydrogenase family protein [bacterium]|nr:prephenate dehydrogenase/arogenate dehydrogenase family protein [bacterium]
MKTRKDRIKIGIIGINGKYGQWLKWFFEQLGCDVIGSDVVGIWTKNRQVVEQADVVVFAVPISTTVAIIEEVVEFSRQGQLFMDVTSLKGPAVRAMLKSKASVLPLHPMCAPPQFGQTLRGQVIVRCDTKDRLANTWRGWVDRMLKATEAKIKISTPEEHDRTMAIVQGLTHAVALLMASVIRTMKIDVAAIDDYVSPPYRVSLSVIGRILNQDPLLYKDIQMNNECINEVLNVLVQEAERFRQIVKSKDEVSFFTDFIASREHFGKEVGRANNFFLGVMKLITDSKKTAP